MRTLLAAFFIFAAFSSYEIVAGNDYYADLDLNKADHPDSETIKRAYRKMAMKYHPDRNPGSAEAETKFKRAAEAYAVLSDPIKKKNYDQGSASARWAAGSGSRNYRAAAEVDIPPWLASFRSDVASLKGFPDDQIFETVGKMGGNTRIDSMVLSPFELILFKTFALPFPNPSVDEFDTIDRMIAIAHAFAFVADEKIPSYVSFKLKLLQSILSREVFHSTQINASTPLTVDGHIGVYILKRIIGYLKLNPSKESLLLLMDIEAKARAAGMADNRYRDAGKLAKMQMDEMLRNHQELKPVFFKSRRVGRGCYRMLTRFVSPLGDYLSFRDSRPPFLSLGRRNR